MSTIDGSLTRIRAVASQKRRGKVVKEGEVKKNNEGKMKTERRNRNRRTEERRMRDRETDLFELGPITKNIKKNISK